MGPKTAAIYLRRSTEDDGVSWCARLECHRVSLVWLLAWLLDSVIYSPAGGDPFGRKSSAVCRVRDCGSRLGVSSTYSQP
jgi:hypothetical protein